MAQFTHTFQITPKRNNAFEITAIYPGATSSRSHFHKFDAKLNLTPQVSITIKELRHQTNSNRLNCC